MNDGIKDSIKNASIEEIKALIRDIENDYYTEVDGRTVPSRSMPHDDYTYLGDLKEELKSRAEPMKIVDELAKTQDWKEMAKKVAEEIVLEYFRARTIFKPFPTISHGIEVIAEEFSELKRDARKKEIDPEKLREEVKQVGAMAVAFIVELIDNNKLNSENMVIK